MMHFSRINLSFCLLNVMFASVASGAIVYVNDDATGLNDGTSWANAYVSLPNALNQAGSGDEIWVAAGNYSAITLKENVRVIGGFAGGEATADTSDPKKNVSRISGGEHNVFCDGLSALTVLRGFVLENGNATDVWEGGGGLYMKDCSATIVDCVFRNNQSAVVGGAVWIFGTTSAPHFANCYFEGNQAVLAGGAVYVGQGNPVFANCLFVNNTATDGGAVGSVFGAPAFCNCTFYGNAALGGRGDAIFDFDGASIVKNSILWGNGTGGTIAEIWHSARGTPDVSYSDVEGGFTGAGNIDADPLFSNPSSGDYRVLPSSPCKNAGSNSDIPQDTGDLDWDGDSIESVPLDFSYDGRIATGIVDIGAHEFSCSYIDPPIANSAMIDNGHGTGNRYISFVAQNPGWQTAIRVKLVDLPPAFASFEGTVMWVDTPQAFSEDSSTVDPGNPPIPPYFMGARLTCSPVYHDWSIYGTVYVYDDEIVPDATYDVQAVFQGCSTFPSTNYSAALSITTSIWGDVTGDCSVPPCTPPDGVADIVDVNAVVDKFQDDVNAPIKGRADLSGDVPDIKVDFTDIGLATDASNGTSYPYDGPTACGGGGGQQ